MYEQNPYNQIISAFQPPRFDTIETDEMQTAPEAQSFLAPPSSGGGLDIGQIAQALGGAEIGGSPSGDSGGGSYKTEDWVDLAVKLAMAFI